MKERSSKTQICATARLYFDSKNLIQMSRFTFTNMIFVLGYRKKNTFLIFMNAFTPVELLH